MKKVLTIIITTLLLSTVGCSDSSSDNGSAELVYGNTSGNLVNGGFVAENDDTVFYVNYSDDCCLYSMNTDGSQKTKLNDNFTSRSINVVGDKVYYSGDDKQLIWDNFGIHSMNADGTEYTHLFKGNSTYMNVVGDWIYYNNSVVGIKKMRTDGKKNKAISKDEDKGSYLNVVGEWIYFRNNSDNGYINKIRTDGKEKTLIVGDDSEYINVADDWIYYQNKSDNSYIYKIRVDGSERTKLSEDVGCNLNVSDNWIYYSIFIKSASGDWDTITSGTAFEDNGIYKMDVDGNNKTRINNDFTEKINVAGDWVYYVNELGDYGLYRVRNDGTDKQRID